MPHAKAGDKNCLSKPQPHDRNKTIENRNETENKTQNIRIKNIRIKGTKHESSAGKSGTDRTVRKKNS
jgi:hypothetical protein